MNRFALISTIALLAAGCASRSAVPATSAKAPLAQASYATAPTSYATAPTSESQGVELRHFYLLSPGPSATLVVTRSDVAPRNRDVATRDR